MPPVLTPQSQGWLLALFPPILKDSFTYGIWSVLGRCQGWWLDGLILSNVRATWLSVDETTRCFFMIELLIKLIGCFSVKKTKTQVKKVTRIGDLWAIKSPMLVGSITFFWQWKSKFSRCAKWLKIRQWRETAAGMDYFLRLYCSYLFGFAAARKWLGALLFSTIKCK